MNWDKHYVRIQIRRAPTYKHIKISIAVHVNEFSIVFEKRQTVTPEPSHGY